MTVKVVVNGAEVEAELSESEANRVYFALQHEFDKEDVQNYLDDFDEELISAETLKKARESLSAIADRYRKFIEDSEDWYYRLSTVVSNWLREQEAAGA